MDAAMPAAHIQNPPVRKVYELDQALSNRGLNLVFLRILCRPEREAAAYRIGLFDG
jgi:hypothetical protein